MNIAYHWIIQAVNASAIATGVIGMEGHMSQAEMSFVQTLIILAVVSNKKICKNPDLH